MGVDYDGARLVRGGFGRVRPEHWSVEATVQRRIIGDGGAHADQDCVVPATEVVGHGFCFGAGDGGAEAGR